MTDNIYVFDEEVNKDSAVRLLSWITSVEPNENGLLVLQTDGGDADYADEIIKALSERPNIAIRAIGTVSSAGFYMYTRSNNHKSLGKYFRYGMVHYPNTYVNLNSIEFKNSKVRTPGEIVQEDFPRLLQEEREFDLQLLNKEESKRYIAAEDVYLPRKRMLEITEYLNNLLATKGSVGYLKEEETPDELTNYITEIAKQVYNAEEQKQKKPQTSNSKKSEKTTKPKTTGKS